MTSPTRRQAALPTFDTAPDIYETPEIADDTSTQPASPRSPSEVDGSGSDTSHEDEDDTFGVSRRRLFPERARRRFEGAGVKSGRVDLSDRVDGRRKGYRLRVGGEEEDESLEARIARLRREVEECRVLAESGKDSEAGGDGVEELSRLLSGIEVSDGRQTRQMNGTHTVDEEEDVPDEQTLARVAHFDSRLSALEQALGLSALESTTAEGVTTPLLPTLTLLDQQLSALSSASSLASLEAAGARIQKLRQEADALSQSLSRPQSSSQSQSQSRPGTANAAQQNGTPASPTESSDEGTHLTPADITQLQSLYTLLPILQSLAPTVPALLTRLRSLRTLHTSAASAASELDEVETRQREMEKELKAWREGLERVEQAVREASEANGRNGKVVEGWVGGLEGRVKGLR